MLSFSILLLCVVIDLEKCRIYTEFVLYIFPVVEGECTRKWSRIDPKFTRKVVKFSGRIHNLQYTEIFLCMVLRDLVRTFGEDIW